MRRKQQGNTFLLTFPCEFPLFTLRTGATLRSESEIFIFEFFLIISNYKVITNEILKFKPNMSPIRSTPTSFRNCFN